MIGPCPHCGYCHHCGRGPDPFAPLYLYWPPPPPWPTYAPCPPSFVVTTTMPTLPTTKARTD